MPSNWLYIDTNFPTFTGEEETEEKVSTIQNYLFMLVEQLRYSLRNLDLGNMNPAAVDRFTGTITEPIYGRIKDAEGNITQLAVTAKGLAAEIRDANGNIASLQATATQLASQISDANGNISVLQQTASSIQSTVTNQAGQISSLQQTADGIQTTVSNQAGQISVIKQTINGLTVTGPSGSTMINGSSIYTGNLYLDSLYGNIIYLRDPAGNIGAQFNVGSASSASNRVEMWARAIYLGTNGNGHVYLDSGSASLQVGDYEIQAGADLIPSAANRYRCGSYAFPWADVYSQDGTISASDRAGKKDIDYDMGKYSGLFDRLRPCSFLRKSGTSGRRHHGFIAQEVKEALEAEGLTGMDFAGYVEWDGGCGLRYEEFIPLCIAKIQELADRVAKLEGRIMA